MTANSFAKTVSKLRNDFRAAVLAIPLGVAGVVASIAWVDDIPAKIDGIILAGALTGFAALQMATAVYKLKKSNQSIFPDIKL